MKGNRNRRGKEAGTLRRGTRKSKRGNKPGTKPGTFVWRKLSTVKWEDVWQERLAWLGQRLVMVMLAGSRALRLEAHQLTQKEADLLVREFGGETRIARALTAHDLEPRPRPPLRIRGKLLIVSSEKERDLAVKHDPGIPVLLIPATIAFGTGEHATTAACLRLLADVAKELRGAEWDALDIGTGSGILALAARIFGARRVEAGDFDPVAVRVAKENAAANSIRGVHFARSNVLKWKAPRRWPVVMANVFSSTLIEAAPRIARAVEKGGRLILSGILREQAPEVAAAFNQQGFEMARAVRKGKWVTLLTRRMERS
jgi:ribosomal protein L11 methyltransferase